MADFGSRDLTYPEVARERFFRRVVDGAETQSPLLVDIEKPARDIALAAPGGHRHSRTRAGRHDAGARAGRPRAGDLQRSGPHRNRARRRRPAGALRPCAGGRRSSGGLPRDAGGVSVVRTAGRRGARDAAGRAGIGSSGASCARTAACRDAPAPGPRSAAGPGLITPSRAAETGLFESAEHTPAMASPALWRRVSQPPHQPCQQGRS
jgi:hypothetical protein